MEHLRSDDQVSLDKYASLPDGRQLVGRMLGGKYQVLEFIGRGGMGSVYRVQHMFLNCDMALKMLDSARVADGVQIRRFQQEGIAANSLNHPCLVKVHDFGLLDSGQPYLVMDLVEGQTLAAFLKKNGPMSLKDINSVFAQVCFGLSYAHNERVVHRDIKPANIMLVKGLRFDTEGSIKIVDFGLAKIATEGQDAQELTRSGEVMGSPIYMSPEQCSGKTIDYRSDIYSLGCVLFEALTGTPPLIGETALRTMMLHQSEIAPTLREASLGKDFPPGLERIIAKMLAKSPNDRYNDLGVVAHELAHACTGSDRVLEPKRPPPKKQAQRIHVTPQLLVIILLSNLVCSSLTFLFMHWRWAAGKTASSLTVDQRDPAGQDRRTQISQFLPLFERNAGTIAAGPPPHATGPIESRIVNDRGSRFREFHFPDIAIGQVTRKWHKELPSPLTVKEGPIETIDAKSTVDVPAEVPLTLEINLTQFPGLVSGADVYKAIGHDEFSGLVLKRDELDDHPSVQEEYMFFSSVLDQAAKWRRLRALRIQNLRIVASEIEAMDKLRHLAVFESRNCTFDPDVLQRAHFLQSVQTVMSSGLLITPELKGSTELTSLSLSFCSCTPEAIESLRSCPHLETLTISELDFNDPLIAAIASLHQVRLETIGCTSLTPAQVKMLLSNPNLQILRLDPQAIDSLRAAGPVDSRVRTLKSP